MEFAAVLTFFLVALFYFLAPVVGYAGSDRQPFVISLWIMVGLFGLGVLKSIINLAEDGGMSRGVQGTFEIVGSLAFLGALFMFVRGLMLQKKA